MTTATRFARYRPILRRTTILLALVCLSMLATTCLNDTPSGPGSAALRLSIAAQISGQAANEWRVGIRVFYTRTTDEEVDLRVSPDEVFVERGTSTTREVSVQIGECLEDPLRNIPEQGGCTLFVELKLLDEFDEVLTQDLQQVHADAAGQTLDAPAFNLAKPFMIFSQSSVTFNVVQGGTLPPQVIVGVSSSTGASLGTLTTNVTYLNRVGWLRSTPSPSQIALRPDSTFLPPDTYEATVRVIASNNSFPDREFRVHYTVAPASATGSINGVIRNSQNAASIAAATVELRLGANNTTGTPLSVTIANALGIYSFSGLQAATYTVVAKATGFLDGSRGSILVAGAVVPNQDVILSPTLAAGQTRIVLTWGNSPSDLDAHLTGPTQDQQQFHICWTNQGSPTSSPFASLDNDEVDGLGPETITISTQVPGTYRFYVFDYSNSPTPVSTPLSGSGARVQVFRGASLLSDFTVPSGAGNLWSVFSLNGSTVTPINTLTQTTAVPGSSCGTLPSSDGAARRKGGDR